MKIHVEAGKLKVARSHEIFADLERLYKDESGNEELRRAVKAKIDARLAAIRDLSSSATSTRKVLADSTDEVYKEQSLLQDFGSGLNSQEIYERLLKRFMPDFTQIALNVAAGWIAQLKLTSETGSALEDLQKAVGAVAEIDMDLVSLRKYIEENTEPGPNPILELQKGNILEAWSDLETEVKKFKASFIDTA
ncbi:hypothetical protein CDD83_4087 [Cordyceps sp. RAO-2017]|nr:hypothetical protein CDD83_4087 [Cordyceps sp. RAO-2017]